MFRLTNKKYPTHFLRAWLIGVVATFVLTCGTAQGQGKTEPCTNVQSVVCQNPQPVKPKINAGSTVCRADIRSVEMQRNCQLVFRQLAEEGRTPASRLSLLDVVLRLLGVLVALAVLAYVVLVVLMSPL